MRISDWSSDVCSSDLCPQRDRLEHVGAAPHAAIEDHLSAALQALHHRRKHLHWGDGRIELPTAMVGEDDGTGAVVARLERIFRTKDTLDRKRSAPVARHPFKVLPTDGGIELLIDETEQRATRIGRSEEHTYELQ